MKDIKIIQIEQKKQVCQKKIDEKVIDIIKYIIFLKKAYLGYDSRRESIPNGYPKLEGQKGKKKIIIKICDL